jgi:hypothetical protein
MGEQTTIQDVLNRLALMQVQVEGVELAFPRYAVMPAQFPAFVNRAGAMQQTRAGGEFRQKWTVHMRLLAGTLEQGFEGGVERRFLELLGRVPVYFAAHARLALDACPAQDIEAAGPLAGLVGPAEINSCTGFQVFTDLAHYLCFGTEFPLSLTLMQRA